MADNRFCCRCCRASERDGLPAASRQVAAASAVSSSSSSAPGCTCRWWSGGGGGDGDDVRSCCCRSAVALVVIVAVRYRPTRAPHDEPATKQALASTITTTISKQHGGRVNVQRGEMREGEVQVPGGGGGGGGRGAGETCAASSEKIGVPLLRNVV